MYDLIIIGGGPGGCAAGVYAARKQLKTLLITESFGGQSIVSDDIQNWIGEEHISGVDLAKKMEKHVRSYEELIDFKVPEKVIKVNKIVCEDNILPCLYEVETNKGEKHQGKAIILTAGARRRKLGVPGEEEYNGKGVAYCSTCDAPLFRNKEVAVVGGGNSGLEAVLDLMPYATKIYLMQRDTTLRGDKVTQDKILNNEKVEIIYNVEIKKIKGETLVTGLVYEDIKTKETKDLAIGGVFIEIGSVPNSEIVANLVDVDKYGQIIIDSKHATTSAPGIFAAGDITDDPYKQNNISAGDAIKATLAAYAYIQQLDKKTPAAG